MSPSPAFAASPSRSTNRTAPTRPASPERAELKARLAAMAGERIDIPLIIGGKEIRTGNDRAGGDAARPRARARRLAQGGARARPAGDRRRRRRRAASGPAGRWRIAPRCCSSAAELLATTWRATLNAATMLGQSKTAFQAEIDAACEMIDFWRFNAALRAGALRASSRSAATACGTRSSTAPLEGFVYAVSPFNFTAIGGNLPTAPALMGNTVIWKPASTRDAERLLHHASCSRRPACRRASSTSCPATPAMIIERAARLAATSAGVHFTGSTAVFNSMWKTVGENIGALPRLSAPRRRDRRQGLHRRAPVGRSGGAGGGDRRAAASSTRGRSARRRAASTCRSRCGTRCATATVAMMKQIQDGRRARLPQLHGRGDRQEGVRPRSAATSTTRSRTRRCCQGGTRDGRRGLLHRADAGRDRRSRLPAAVRGDLRPGRDRATSIRTTKWSETLDVVDRTSPYALTGAVFARDRAAVREAIERAAQRRRQLLHQRQADRRGRRAAAVRRRARRRAPTTRPARS